MPGQPNNSKLVRAAFQQEWVYLTGSPMCWCPFLSAKEDGSPGFSTHLLASLIWENSQVGREGRGVGSGPAWHLLSGVLHPAGEAAGGFPFESAGCLAASIPIASGFLRTTKKKILILPMG